MVAKAYPFWMVSPHVFVLGAGASRAAFPDGDKRARKLPLVADFVETLQLQELLENHHIKYSGKNIEEIYDQLFAEDTGGNGLAELNSQIVHYLSQLEIPEQVTIYDELILSLQKKDAIFSFNWDPLLAQAYKRNLGVKQLPEMHFLHGNVAIGVCQNDRQAGYLDAKCSVCQQPFEPSKLLFPISKKEYALDPFIKSEWDALRQYLHDAFIVTLFGYSAPRTDVEARNTMIQEWMKNERSEFNETEIIDTKSRDLIESTWSEFIGKDHYGIFDSVHDSLSFRYARRSCNAFGDAIMQSDPWSENPLPHFTALQDLQTWVRPLIEEEIQFDEKDVRLPKFKKALSRNL
jgi:hypothetical protein